ncbi:hypothetical protein ACIP88_17415 [Streptomyces uncialis]|uniref:hypothetical protein n=1 Tax=Streptomyces uncialis TaxID=1048205 RepID=UPI0037F41365
MNDETVTNTGIPSPEALAGPAVFTTPEVADLGGVVEVTLGSGGFNNPDHTMYYQG